MSLGWRAQGTLSCRDIVICSRNWGMERPQNETVSEAALQALRAGRRQRAGVGLTL